MDLHLLTFSYLKHLLNLPVGSLKVIYLILNVFVSFLIISLLITLTIQYATMRLQTVLASALFTILMSCNTTPMENSSNGLIKKISANDFDTTYNTLKTVIENNPNLKIILELDHSKNAASVDLELRKTKIILFGNPKLGTPLMQNSPTVSIDLPQKIIVFTDKNNVVNVAYNDPQYLKTRHTITDAEVILDKISNALNTITDKAISKS